MSIIYEEKKDEGLIAGYPVRKTFFKKDEVLHFDKINKQWIAKPIAVSSPGGIGDMPKATYDPTNVADDAFNMDNMAEGTDTKILTSAERALIASALQSETSHSDVLVDGDIGVSVQGYDVNTVKDASYVHTDVNFTSAKDSKLSGIEASADVTSTHETSHADVLVTADIGINVQGYNVNILTILNNLLAKAPPSVTDDEESEYAIGSRWIDLATDKVYECTDNRGGQAVWVDLTEDIPVVSDVAYDAGTWDNNLDAPSKNAVRDVVETLETKTVVATKINSSLAIGLMVALG